MKKIATVLALTALATFACKDARRPTSNSVSKKASPAIPKGLVRGKYTVKVIKIPPYDVGIEVYFGVVPAPMWSAPTGHKVKGHVIYRGHLYVFAPGVDTKVISYHAMRGERRWFQVVNKGVSIEALCGLILVCAEKRGGLCKKATAFEPDTGKQRKWVGRCTKAKYPGIEILPPIPPDPPGMDADCLPSAGGHPPRKI